MSLGASFLQLGLESVPSCSEPPFISPKANLLLERVKRN